MVKNPSANVGDLRDVCLIPGLGRSPGGGHNNSLQHSCLENPIDRGAWQATVHGIAELDMTEAQRSLKSVQKVVTWWSLWLSTYRTNEEYDYMLEG